MDEDTINILEASLADSTSKQYSTELRQWFEFCNINNKDPYLAEDRTILRFLTDKFNKKAAYGTLNTARSAVALINDRDNSKSKLINRFFQGVYRLRPTTPKYCSTWDPSVVLSKVETWSPIENISLEKLTLKLVILLALGSAFRVQTMSLIKLKEISYSSKGVSIRVASLIKTSKPGAKQPSAFFPYFKNKPNLCIAKTIVHYINRTRDIRKDDYLFISYQKPHRAVTSQTISKWIKKVLSEAGIDSSFTAHSTRHASTSSALAKGLDLNSIRRAAGWTESSNTFSRFYNRPVEDMETNFAKVVFEC